MPAIRYFEMFLKLFGDISNRIQSGRRRKVFPNGVIERSENILSSTIYFFLMSNKTRSVLKGVAVVMVLLAVVMHIGWVIIPAIAVYRFWIVVIAFGLLLISSK